MPRWTTPCARGGSRPSGAYEPVTRMQRLLPVVGWLPRYDRRWLRGDIAAGIAVTALIVPKNLGYAGIAGVPLQNGLYAAAAGAIIYALFCTSRHISTGPSSSLAAVAGGAVAVAGLAGERGGRSWSRRSRWRPDCCSCCSPCSGWAGSPSSSPGRWSRASSPEPPSTWSSASCRSSPARRPRATAHGASSASWARSLDDVHATTVLVGVVRAGRHPRPAAGGARRPRRARARRGRDARLGALRSRRARRGTGGRGAARVAGARAARISRSSATTPRPSAIAAVALLLIGFSQTAGDARAFAARHRYRIDVNQESVAQGMANVGAGVFQGMPVSTSLSASSLNESAGARTPLASLVTGGLVHRDAARARAAVLRPPEGGAGRRDHRRGRLRHDRRGRAPPPVPRDALRLLGGCWRRSSACSPWACWRAS